MHDFASYAALITGVVGAIVSALTSFIATRKTHTLSRKIEIKGGFVKKGLDAEDIGHSRDREPKKPS